MELIARCQLAAVLATLLLLSGVSPAATQIGDGAFTISMPTVTVAPDQDTSMQEPATASPDSTATSTPVTEFESETTAFPTPTQMAANTNATPGPEPTFPAATPEPASMTPFPSTTTTAADSVGLAPEVGPTTSEPKGRETTSIPTTTTSYDDTPVVETTPSGSESLSATTTAADSATSTTTAAGGVTTSPSEETTTAAVTVETPTEDSATTVSDSLTAVTPEMPSQAASPASVIPFSSHTHTPMSHSTRPATADPHPVPESYPNDGPGMDPAAQPSQPVQFFPRGTTFDLQGTSLTFRPDRVGGSYYSICKNTGGKSFPINTVGSTDLRLSDESVARISFTNFIFPFYGKAYTSAYVGSNGYISFGSSDDSFMSGDLSEQHFDKPRISGLLSDLAPDSESEISWKETSEYVVITFKNVPQFDNPFHRNDFQIALSSDGSVGIGFVKVLSFGARVVGLSSGTGRPEGLEQTDLSTVDGCPPQTNSYNYNNMYGTPSYTLNNGNMEQLYSWWKFWHSFFPQRYAPGVTNSRPSDSQHFFSSPSRTFYSSRNGIYYP